MRCGHVRGRRVRTTSARIVVAVLCEGQRQSGGGRGEKKEGYACGHAPAKDRTAEDNTPKETAPLRRRASGNRGVVSGGAPRHGRSSFSEGRDPRSPHTLRATRLRRRAAA
jgi:hypothetical protein